MQLPALNPSIIIIVILLLGGVYGLMAGKQRLRILILSVYVGIVVAEQLAGAATPLLPSLGADQISWGLFALPIVIFGFFGVMHAKGHAKGVWIANVIVGLLTGALIVSSALRLLPTSEMAAIDANSFLATNLQQFHIWILGGLPLIALVLGFMKGEKPSH